MFPFLAPIRTPSTRCSIRLDPNRPVEITFFTSIPTVEVITERVRNISGASDGTGSTVDSSRPRSRAKNKSPNPVQQVSSARSAKSSPIPPPVPEAVPPYSRHKNKGLETSSAMMELFGGGSAYGHGSAFSTVSHPQDTVFHGRKNFQKDFEEQRKWETVKAPTDSDAIFSKVEDHVAAYHAVSRSKRRQSGSSSDKISQPGPEFVGGNDDADESELPPDPECPAAKLLEEMEAAAISSPQSSPVDLMGVEASTSEPGPDLGDEEEPADGGSGGADSSGEERDAAAARDAEDSADQETTGDGSLMLLIKGAQVVNDDSIFNADVLVQDGVIKNVAPGLEVPSGAQVIEAGGKLLIPAGIDVHTHLSSSDSCDDVPTGCRAALAGGTGTVVEMVVPSSGESLSAAVSRVKKSFDSPLCNYAFSVVIRTFSESVKKEMEKVVNEGINSFIVDLDSDDALYQVLETCHSLGAHARVVPENKGVVSLLEKKLLNLGINGPEGFVQSRPAELEKERISNISLLSQLTNCPVSIVSVSSADAVESIDKARGSGALAHPEIATAAVASSSSKYFDKDLKVASAHLTDLPIREDSARLVNALTSQPLAVCASGHRAISSATRLTASDFSTMPKGAAGVEERLAVVWEKAVRNGRIDPMRFVAVTSTNAAKIFNIYPKKGRIAVGADADFVLWDTSVKRKLGASVGQSAEDVSLYEGFGVHSQALITVVGGRVAWKDGGVKDAKGAFLSLSPNSPYLFSVVQHRDKASNFEKVERDPVTNGVNGAQKKTSFDNTPIRPRKSHFESNISFGTDSRAAPSRNPPGGRSTGLW